MIRPLLRSTLALLGAVALTSLVSAQTTAPLAFPAPSPAATIKQRVGITDIEITYARPSAKDRQVFGSLVPYDQVWRTGANSATKITFSTDVTLDGAAIPAGTYELFTIPGTDSWTVIVHKNLSQWGNYAYKAENDIARATATPVALSTPVETFTISFGDLRDDSATLNLAWEKTLVSVNIAIDTKGILAPQIAAAMASDEPKKPYFASAMFYFENEIDLAQALTWMNAGLAEQPNAFWMIYRKGLLLAKMGDKDGARAAALASMELAQKREGALRDEYLRLNQALIASLD